METNVPQLKQEQRSACLAARRSLSVKERQEKSARIVDALLALPEIRSAKRIFSYMPMEEEVDVGPLEAHLSKHGATIAYPVTGPDGMMEAYTSRSFCSGTMGIREPDTSCGQKMEPSAIDVVIVPCVGVDHARRRLGHGGGYYDRYLSRCDKAVKIGVAFTEQIIPCVATDDCDIEMDRVVTDTVVIDGRQARRI